MEEGSSSQASITPELLQALARQLMETTTTINKPITINVGPYKLNPVAKDKAFKTTKPVSETEQCIIDYLWNAKNRAQTTMSLQALAWYLHHKATTTTTTHKALRVMSDDTASVKLEPQIITMHYKKLEMKNREMEEDLKIVEGKIKNYEEITENYKKLKEYVREKELEEKLETWRNFSSYYTPEKEQLMDTIFAEKMGHQIHLQKILRSLCRSTIPILKGISYKITTYKNDTGFKGCSFVSCSVDLSIYRDTQFEGANISLDGLLKEGALHQLQITKKHQLQHIQHERLRTTLQTIMEDEPLGLSLRTIPPSYFSKHLDVARSTVFIDTIKTTNFTHKSTKEGDLVSEESVDLLDQIYYYRSIVYQEDITCEDYFLITASHDMKIYARKEYNIPYANQQTAHPDQVLYFNKLGMQHYSTTSGDTTEITPIIGSLSPASFSETTEANIVNAMEA